MTHHIVISAPYQEDYSDVISIGEYDKKRQSRRKRVSRRMAKKYPLFALEFMKEEFPEMDYDTWEEDVITRKKSKSKRKSKSPMQRQGRYPLFQKAMNEYRFSKDLKDLEKAQQLRDRMFKDFLFVFTLGNEKKTYRLPSTASLGLVKRISSIKGYKTWEELEERWAEITRYEQF